MKTELDVSRSWFVHWLSYHRELHIVLAEGILGKPIMNDERLPEGSRPVTVEKESRTFLVRFPKAVAWQVVREEFTVADKSEIGEKGGVLRVIEKSKYLDYVEDQHGWYKDVIGPGTHYRLITETDIIEVVACAPPIIAPWKRPEVVS